MTKCEKNTLSNPHSMASEEEENNDISSGINIRVVDQISNKEANKLSYLVASGNAINS